MGAYLYGTKLSRPVRVALPNGQTAQVYRYEWLGRARDLDPPTFSEASAAARRLKARVGGIERAWDQCRPEFVVHVDGDGRPYHGAPLHRFTGTSGNVVWCDDAGPPLEYVGTLVPDGRGWKAVPMTEEEQRRIQRGEK